ncbi:FprA family A-type flavoprotein [Thermodesulfobacteriota bacterium]
MKITDNVHYVGIFDKELRVFDVIMRTEHGTTYNSYLITGEKNVLIETVKEGFTDEFIANISKIIDPKDIDYIILNHTEPDHSGALKNILKIAPKAVVYASKGACINLKNILNEDFEHVAVKDGDELSLGDKKIKFISAPFLHWPDSMFSYLEDENLLFTCDAFGSHFCDERLFDDLVGDYHYDFLYYFAHIMRPFKDNVISACDKISDLDIKMICPSHGPVLRADPQKTIAEYREMSHIEKSVTKAIIVHVSAYGNTTNMAEKIKEGLVNKGVEVAMYEATDVDIGSLLDDFEHSSALVLGSPTINGDALKPIHDVLSSLATVKIRGKIGAAFGSFGWSGEAVNIIQARMKSIKLKTINDGVKVKFIPTADDLQTCVKFGEDIADAIKV